MKILPLNVLLDNTTEFVYAYLKKNRKYFKERPYEEDLFMLELEFVKVNRAEKKYIYIVLIGCVFSKYRIMPAILLLIALSWHTTSQSAIALVSCDICPNFSKFGNR